MSYLVGNPEDRFSHDKAQIIVVVTIKNTHTLLYTFETLRHDGNLRPRSWHTTVVVICIVYCAGQRRNKIIKMNICLCPELGGHRNVTEQTNGHYTKLSSTNAYMERKNSIRITYFSVCVHFIDVYTPPPANHSQT